MPARSRELGSAPAASSTSTASWNPISRGERECGHALLVALVERCAAGDQQLDRGQVGLLDRDHEQRAPAGRDRGVGRRGREHARERPEVALLDRIADVRVLLFLGFRAPALHHPHHVARHAVGHQQAQEHDASGSIEMSRSASTIATVDPERHALAQVDVLAAVELDVAHHGEAGEHGERPREPAARRAPVTW